MALLELLAVLLALLGLCALLVRATGLSGGLAPLAVLALVVLVLWGAGMANLLWLVWAVLALGWLGGAYVAATAVRRGTGRALLHSLFSPAGALFWVGALVLACWLAWLQPEFTAFDEYSFWGTAAKLTTLNGKLYTVCESGVPWQMTQLAALPLTSYFFQPFGIFYAWRTIFAGDAVLLAGLSAVVALVEKAGRRLWGPMGLAVLLLPTALSVSNHTAALNTAWLEFMGDMPAGVLFGGAVAFWLAVREAGGPLRWLTLPVLCMAGSIKANTFVLALAAAGLIAVDAVLFPAGDAPHGARALAGRLGFGAACLAAPAAQYLLWSRYTAALAALNAQTGGLGDTTNVSLPSVVVNGIKVWRGRVADNYFEWHRQDFYDYQSAMRTAFAQQRISIFGTGANVCILLGLVFVLAVILAPAWREKLRVAVAAACSAGCFFGYWLMLLFSYAFVLKDSTPENMASYSRYFASFYVGWALVALALLARQAAAARRKNLAHGAVLALAFAAAVLTGRYVEPQFTVLQASRGEYTSVRAEQSIAAWAQGCLQPADRVFLVYQGDAGNYWFLYSEALAPNLLVYGAGGGTYGTPSLRGYNSYYQAYSWEDFSALMEREAVDYLLVVQMDEIFSQSYARLFTDELAAAQSGPVLYRVTAQGYAPAFLWSEEEAGR